MVIALHLLHVSPCSIPTVLTFVTSNTLPPRPLCHSLLPCPSSVFTQCLCSFSYTYCVITSLRIHLHRIGQQQQTTSTLYTTDYVGPHQGLRYASSLTKSTKAKNNTKELPPLKKQKNNTRIWHLLDLVVPFTI